MYKIKTKTGIVDIRLESMMNSGVPEDRQNQDQRLSLNFVTASAVTEICGHVQCCLSDWSAIWDQDLLQSQCSMFSVDFNCFPYLVCVEFFDIRRSEVKKNFVRETPREGHSNRNHR